MELLIGPRAYSTWSLRPWLVLKRAGAQFETLHARYDTPEHKAALVAVSPSGLVPLLRHGDLVLWDSLAISEWAAEMWPDAALWPKDASVRAVARSCVAEMHSGFSALRRVCGTSADHPQVGPSTVPTPQDAELSADLRRLVSVWCQMRASHGAGGDYLFGQWSIADAFFTPVAARIRHFQLDLEAHGDVEGVAAAYGRALLNTPEYLEWEALALAGQ